MNGLSIGSQCQKTLCRAQTATKCSIMTSCRRDRKLAAITEVARLALCKEGVFDPWVDWEGHAKRRPEAFVELLAAYLAQACRELVSADDNDRGNRRSKLDIVCDAKRCMSMYRLTSSRDVPVPLQDLVDICGQYLWTTDTATRRTAGHGHGRLSPGPTQTTGASRQRPVFTNAANYH